MFRYAFILSGYIKLILHRSQVSEDNHEFILTPISIMLEGLSLRFRFHFETSKPTNRIDKVIKKPKRSTSKTYTFISPNGIYNMSKIQFLHIYHF